MSSSDVTTDFRTVSRAIQNYLRHEYANAKFDIDNDPPPMKISTYSGKGVGHYQTGLDGRADWTQDFYKYIERSERRAEADPDLRFGFREVDVAMMQLQIDHPRWHEILHAVCIDNMKIDDVAETYKRDVSSVYRYLREATMFIWRYLLGNRTRNKLAVKIIRFI